ncbi:hypothetical protein CFE70_009778 [Pyrenophora teres f. teres 0-1]
MCLKFLAAIKKVFRQFGGPWDQPCRIKGYSIARKSWHMALLEVSKPVNLLDILMDYEEKWESENAKDAGVIWTTNSPTKALRKVEIENKYPAVVEELPSSAHPSAPLGVEWMDTSRVSSSIADILSLKVYVTLSDEEF